MTTIPNFSPHSAVGGDRRFQRIGVRVCNPRWFYAQYSSLSPEIVDVVLMMSFEYAKGEKDICEKPLEIAGLLAAHARTHVR